MEQDRPTPPELRGISPTPWNPCIRCGQGIDASFTYCPHCGKPQREGAAWYYHPVWILVLGLLVIGPFALPLVLRSTKMTLAQKWIVGVLIVGNTVLVLYYTYRITQSLATTLRMLMGVMPLR